MYKSKKKGAKKMLKEKTMCVGDLVSNREFDVNCNFDIYDCTKPGTDWTNGAKRIFSTIENGWVEPPDDVLTHFREEFSRL